MAGATIAPSLPQIEQVFSNHPHSEILTKLILTIPALFIALGAPVVGLLIDRYGRVRLLLGSLLLYGFSGTSGFFMNDIYSPQQAAELLGVTKDHILRLIKSKKLIASNIGLGQRSVWRISHEEINKFLTRSKKKTNESRNTQN